jgi:hypothetical protein
LTVESDEAERVFGSRTAVHFNLTISHDVCFVATVRQLAERVAQCAGFATADAIRVAASVGLVTETLLSRAPAGNGEALDIRFERDATALDVTFRYRPFGGGRPGGSVDPSLAGDAMRQGMDSVEFGAEGEIEFCRLRRTLPHEKFNHQCEMPPPD